MVLESLAALVRPPSRPRAPWMAARNGIFVAGALILAGFLTMAAVPGSLTHRSPTMVEAGQMFRPPGPGHVFGTDRFGRDVFTRVVYGARISLEIAGVSVSGAVVVGGSFGLLAGYAGGWTDQVLGRLMDIFFAFPPILLALAIAAIMGAGSVAAVTAIGVVYAPLFFRVVRGSVLAERELAYVEAARALGARPLGIMVRHILPNVLSPLIIQVAVTLSYAVLIESALSYLGVGVQPPTPSWGTTLNEGKEFLELAPWVSLFPGLAIMLCVLSFNFLSDGMRDLLDPRLHLG